MFLIINSLANFSTPKSEKKAGAWFGACYLVMKDQARKNWRLTFMYLGLV